MSGSNFHDSLRINLRDNDQIHLDFSCPKGPREHRAFTRVTNTNVIRTYRYGHNMFSPPCLLWFSLSESSHFLLQSLSIPFDTVF